MKAFSFKKFTMIMMALTLLFAVVAPSDADARRGGGFSSGKRSYQTTPSKPNDSSTNNNVNRSETNRSNNGTVAGSTNNRTGGFFGGGFMRGMMIGGLAGLLFGGLFANMGMLGSLLGLAINLLGIYLLVVIGFAIYRSIRNRRKQQEESREGRY
ncbi:hypothetical protein ACE3NQ_02790 [Paenibacillus terreus]|uniref:Import inner membrane translocase subunit Tim44 n=1 Tax=Paenibacillus terreus TaxID=1387834 RepID=A0ABV5B2E4_9BACL